MKCYPLIALLLLTSFIAVTGASWHIPATYIPGGLTVHFGSDWISTTTPLLLTAWFENNWVNYTVTGPGTQQVYNGTKPYSVCIDGINQTEGSGWAYGSGITTITAASSSVTLQWFTPEIPPVIPHVLESLPLPTGDSVEVYGDCVFSFAQTQSLICSHADNISLELTVISGVFNGSGTVDLRTNQGILTITPTTDSVVQFTDLYSRDLSISVNGVGVGFGENVYIGSSSSPIIIQWQGRTPLLVPITFIVGSVGLGCLFGGPILAINKFREHHYKDGFVIGVIVVTAGIGLVLTWLFA